MIDDDRGLIWSAGGLTPEGKPAVTTEDDLRDYHRRVGVAGDAERRTIDYRELLRKYIAHAFANGPDYVVAKSAAEFAEDSLRYCQDFTPEEKAELVRLASEEAR